MPAAQPRQHIRTKPTSLGTQPISQTIILKDCFVLILWYKGGDERKSTWNHVICSFAAPRASFTSSFLAPNSRVSQEERQRLPPLSSTVTKPMGVRAPDSTRHPALHIPARALHNINCNCLLLPINPAATQKRTEMPYVPQDVCECSAATPTSEPSSRKDAAFPLQILHIFSSFFLSFFKRFWMSPLKGITEQRKLSATFLAAISQVGCASSGAFRLPSQHCFPLERKQKKGAEGCWSE